MWQAATLVSTLKATVKRTDNVILKVGSEIIQLKLFPGFTGQGVNI